jgi:hypothetical protein
MKSENPLIRCVIHHRQNPIESRDCNRSVHIKMKFATLCSVSSLPIQDLTSMKEFRTRNMLMKGPPDSAFISVVCIIRTLPAAGYLLSMSEFPC